jgi:RNA polymerase sigma factor (TIGR02999 family)
MTLPTGPRRDGSASPREVEEAAKAAKAGAAEHAAAHGGDADAVERLMPVVYDELRRIARRQLQDERPNHTLTTTALVHEAYLKLGNQDRAEWVDRTHFLAVASRAMRRILIDYARQHRALKRGGEFQHISIEAAAPVAADRGEMLLELDEALSRLAVLDPRQARIVECRFFGGMTEEETASVLDLTSRTIRREWVKAKAWLYAELTAPGTA